MQLLNQHFQRLTLSPGVSILRFVLLISLDGCVLGFTIYLYTYSSSVLVGLKFLLLWVLVPVPHVLCRFTSLLTFVFLFPSQQCLMSLLSLYLVLPLFSVQSGSLCLLCTSCFTLKVSRQCMSCCVCSFPCLIIIIISLSCAPTSPSVPCRVVPHSCVRFPVSFCVYLVLPAQFAFLPSFGFVLPFCIQKIKFQY